MNDMKIRRPMASPTPVSRISQAAKTSRSWKQKFVNAGRPRKIGIILLALMVLVFFFNFSYFWKNIKFTIVKPKAVLNQDQPALTEKQNNKIEPNTLIIDSLGLKLPVIFSDDKSEGAFQEALKNGVVHYPDTAKAGEYGNVYIFGHSSDYLWSKGKYKTAFALLPRIQKGALVVLSDERGNAYNYRVTDTFIVAPNDLSVLDQLKYQKRYLTLQTSYPIGTALKRYIVRAEIEEPKSDGTEPQVGT